jgi:hypothetical protein
MANLGVANKSQFVKQWQIHKARITFTLATVANPAPLLTCGHANDIQELLGKKHASNCIESEFQNNFTKSVSSDVGSMHNDCVHRHMSLTLDHSELARTSSA